MSRFNFSKIWQINTGKHFTAGCLCLLVLVSLSSQPLQAQERVNPAIESAVKTADPESFKRKQNLDFANWAFEKMGGNR